VFKLGRDIHLAFPRWLGSRTIEARFRATAPMARKRCGALSSRPALLRGVDRSVAFLPAPLP